MIVKMDFVSITGPKEEFDHMVEQYLINYDVHLENAYLEFKTEQNITTFIEANPYKDIINNTDELFDYFDDKSFDKSSSITSQESVKTVKDLTAYYQQATMPIINLTNKKDQLQKSLDKILPFKDLDYDVKEILNFKYIKFRFGRIPKEYWKNFEPYVTQDKSSIFTKCTVDNTYVWGVYFVTKKEHEKIDAVYSSLHFERTFIPDEYKGTPDNICNELMDQINVLSKRINELKQRLNDYMNTNREKYLNAHHKISTISNNFEIRKMAACTIDNKKVYFIICGWMAVKDAKKLTQEIKVANDKITCVIQSDHKSLNSSPPTKLNNPGIFKPYEMYIKMYGLPAYNEFDPTILIALTYSFIFGIMFGDIGQGLCLLIVGLFLNKFKNLLLGGIIACAGFFSTIFGFLFGSFFGFENVIHAVWIKPLTNMMNLPLIGRLNTIFILSIGFGMLLIILSMIFNILNGFKSHHIKSVILDSNGFVGLLFYGSMITVILLLLTGHPIPGTLVLIIMFVIPLLLIGFKVPIINTLSKKQKHITEGKLVFVIQIFFEMFEILLSYFSNTLSFIRIGAFAISHAAIMEVMLLLSGIENGSPNIFILIVGNLIVVGLEGLIVGIQVLRLEYYELFSRFYKGNGREFKPFKHSY